MLELSIPQIGENSKNAKDLVFTILSKEQPLSLIELSNKVQKNYNVTITYQAVRKAVDLMLKQGVLEKTGKKYSINKKWVLNLKSFFDNLLANYDTGKKTRSFNKEMAKEDYAVYTFNNLLDLDNFWGEIMLYWANHRKKEEQSSFLSCFHYSFWFLINLGRETGVHENMMKKGVKIYELFCRTEPLNQWGAKIYREIGAKVHILENSKIQPGMDLCVMGDVVFHIKYPEHIVEKLQKFYGKYKTTQEMSLKEITEIAHSEGEIKFIMFRNPQIANDLRKRYMKYF